MSGSLVLTPNAKEAAIGHYLMQIQLIKYDIHNSQRELASLEAEYKRIHVELIYTRKGLRMAENELKQTEAALADIQSQDASPAPQPTGTRVSKNGKPLGRPRLSAEQKAANKAAREAARQAASAGGADSPDVVVPEDLTPLIP